MFSKNSVENFNTKKLWGKFKNYFLENFSLKVVIAFCIFLTIFLSIDILSKHFLFEKDNLWIDNLSSKNYYGIIGIRSVPHGNSTIFSALDWKLPLWSRYLINFSLAFFFIVPVFFSKSIYLAVIMALVTGGILGNSIDMVINKSVYYKGAIRTNYVRDILWVPWWDRGTFNIADIWIVSGSGLLFVRLIISLFKPENPNIVEEK